MLWRAKCQDVHCPGLARPVRSESTGSGRAGRRLGRFRCGIRSFGRRGRRLGRCSRRLGRRGGRNRGPQSKRLRQQRQRLVRIDQLTDQHAVAVDQQHRGVLGHAVVGRSRAVTPLRGIRFVTPRRQGGRHDRDGEGDVVSAPTFVTDLGDCVVELLRLSIGFLSASTSTCTPRTTSPCIFSLS